MSQHYFVTDLIWRRRQRVQILCGEFCKTSSGWETTKNGVPQGSSLSPLLFLLHINDLSLGISIDYKLLLHTDDTRILISGPYFQEVQSKSLNALDSIKKWCMTTGLSLNLKKTKIMIFESNQQNNAPFFKLHVGLNKYKRK
jgi:hypothetical protein